MFVTNYSPLLFKELYPAILKEIKPCLWPIFKDIAPPESIPIVQKHFGSQQMSNMQLDTFFPFKSLNCAFIDQITSQKCGIFFSEPPYTGFQFI